MQRVFQYALKHLRCNHRVYARRLSTLSLPSKRWYSISPIVTTPGNVVNVQVKHGLHSPISASIVYPPKPEKDGPIILNLGHALPKTGNQAYAQELCISANATIVEPSYHASGDHPYPAPIHSTLAVFDWISQNLLRQGSDVSGDPKRSSIGVCGGFVGGSLATMLALTECNPSKSHVCAAAVESPILDWTDIFPAERAMTIGDLQAAKIEDQGTPKATSPSDEAMADMSSLMTCRRDIFSKPQQFFDPFASPLLFFRTPYFDLPYVNRSYRPTSPLSSAEDESLARDDDTITRKRLYKRAYPPQGSKLKLPPMKITAGKEWVLKHQAEELGKHLRNAQQEGRKVSINDENNTHETRYRVEEKQGLGLWSSRDIMEVGHWFGEVLRKS